MVTYYTTNSLDLKYNIFASYTRYCNILYRMLFLKFKKTIKAFSSDFQGRMLSTMAIIVKKYIY